MVNENSSDWLEIKKLAIARLERARKNNDAIGLSMEKTEANRGRIAELLWLLSLPEEQKKAHLQNAPGDGR